MTARCLRKGPRQDGLPARVSTLALINRLPMVGSFVQLGTSPHRRFRICRSTFFVWGSACSTTAYMSLVGATLYDGASSSPTAVASYNSDSSARSCTDTYLPHMPSVLPEHPLAF